jgi:Uma2 family endonuclease
MRSPPRAPKVEPPKPRASAQRHVRPIVPVYFRDQEPAEEQLPESQRHLQLCKALHEILCALVSPAKSCIGADQFVYFRANDPRSCLAPDAFVRLGIADEAFACWKTWERGAPEIAFEILSASDSTELWSLEEKLTRYDELGVRELIVFELDAVQGQRLRAWDRIDGDFVERVVENEQTPCFTLDCDVTVAPVLLTTDAQYPACVRLVRDGTFVPTLEEARHSAEQAAYTAAVSLRKAEEAQEADAQASRAEAQSQRDAALARGEVRAAEIEAAAARVRAGR